MPSRSPAPHPTPSPSNGVPALAVELPLAPIPEQLVAAPSGQILPAWMWRLSPDMQAAYMRGLSADAGPAMNLQYLADLMDRQFGRVANRTEAKAQTQTHSTSDVRVQHLNAVQRQANRVRAAQQVDSEAEEIPADPFAL